MKWRAKRHDLVITDLQMPEMDGYAFARAIRAEQRPSDRLTVVAFTANTQREALDRCGEAGMDDYLTKPTELVTLREKLARWMGSEAGLRSALPERRAGTSRDDPIDRSRIHELVGDAEGLARVLSEVEAGARHDVAALQAALAHDDVAAMRMAAHRIKGSALTIGAKRLAAAAISAEQAGDAGDKAALLRAVHALVEELELVRAVTRTDLGAAAA